MMKPVLSFVVPVYNRQDVLPVCLDAILAADVDGYEIVVVDDASTDSTVRVVEEYAHRHPCIRLHRLEENRGPGFARNAGAEYAWGQFLYFVDSDDTVNADALPRLFAALRANNDVDVLSANNTRVAPAGRRSPELWITEEGRYSALEFMNRHPYQVARQLWVYIFNREFFLRCGMKIPETRNMEDMCFSAYALFKARSAYALPVNLYNYHMLVEGSLATRLNYQSNLDGFDAICTMLAALPRQGDEHSAHYRYAFRVSVYIVASIMGPDRLLHYLRLFNDRDFEREPGIEEYEAGCPEALTAKWFGYHCRRIAALAAERGKSVFLVPATLSNIRLARLFKAAEVTISGFMDNNPSATNSNVTACRTEGHEVFDLKSVAGRKDCLLPIFCHRLHLADILDAQLSRMGLVHGVDYVSVYR